MEFLRENFRGLLPCTAYCSQSLPTFTEKTFADKNKAAKFAENFSLKSFLLYSIHVLPYDDDLLVHTFFTAHNVCTNTP